MRTLAALALLLAAGCATASRPVAEDPTVARCRHVLESPAPKADPDAPIAPGGMDDRVGCARLIAEVESRRRREAAEAQANEAALMAGLGAFVSGMPAPAPRRSTVCRQAPFTGPGSTPTVTCTEQ